MTNEQGTQIDFCDNPDIANAYIFWYKNAKMCWMIYEDCSEGPIYFVPNDPDCPDDSYAHYRFCGCPPDWVACVEPPLIA